MPKEIVLTKKGLDELKAKIEFLQNDRRREVAARIKEAREFGDISENAEYDDAKNEQAMLEKQISDLEEKLRSAKVIDSKDVTGDTVTVGTTPSNSCGKGSIPCSRRRSSFARRSSTARRLLSARSW